MIKGNLALALDGDFKKTQPTPERFAYRGPDGKWRVVARGPRYSNVYDVTEYDVVGAQWLMENDRTDEDER